MGLYRQRYLIDRGFRRDCAQALQREGVDPAPLFLARPGTVLWRLLSERVGRILRHDDALDRVFPIADPTALGEPARGAELRILACEAPSTAQPAGYRMLLWFQILAGVDESLFR